MFRFNHPIKKSMISILKTSAERQALYRLSILLLLSYLLAIRIMVLLHEYIGHNFAIYLCGLKCEYFFIYLFGGASGFPQSGTISPAGALFITLAGNGIELVVGIALIFLRKEFKRGSVLNFVIILFSVILFVHVLSSTAVLTHYGTSDLKVFSKILNSWRPYFVTGVILLLFIATTVLSKIYFNNFSVWFPNFKAKQIFIIAVITLSFAIGGHTAITMAEVHYIDKQLAKFPVQKDVNNTGNTNKEQKDQTDSLSVNQPDPLIIEPYVYGGVLVSALLGFHFSMKSRKRRGIDDVGAAEENDKKILVIPSWLSIFKLSLILAALLVVILLIRTPWSMYNEVKAKKGLSVIIESPPANTKNSIATQNSNETGEND